MGTDKMLAPTPKNWPSHIAYLTSPHYSPSLTPAQLAAIRSPDPDLATLPSNVKLGPSSLVRIAPISDPAHPAKGQAGLFALRDILPGSVIVPYMGEVHIGSGAAADVYKASNYDLWMDREADVAVDASRMGNEARFVNDYRGIPGSSRPNAEFIVMWDARRGEKMMVVCVLGQGKKDKGLGVRKGQEILVSYGKGFWSNRQKESSEQGTEADGG